MFLKAVARIFCVENRDAYSQVLTEAPGQGQQGMGHQGQNFPKPFMSKVSPIEGILDPKRFGD